MVEVEDIEVDPTKTIVTRIDENTVLIEEVGTLRKPKTK